MKIKKKAKSYDKASKVLANLKIAPTLGQLIRSLRECDETLQVELA